MLKYNILPQCSQFLNPTLKCKNQLLIRPNWPKNPTKIRPKSAKNLTCSTFSTFYPTFLSDLFFLFTSIIQIKIKLKSNIGRCFVEKHWQVDLFSKIRLKSDHFGPNGRISNPGRLNPTYLAVLGTTHVYEKINYVTSLRRCSDVLIFWLFCLGKKVQILT